ncbi:MAG TPA: hypothetical protein VFW94_23960 [Candidatus Acidoferrales bacterium]|nr:hypothetical protein [Candidatus Acidoferrales bacterium]
MEDTYTIPYGRNSYCGPAALAYVTRTDPDTAAAHLRRWGRLRAVKGVSNDLLQFTMRQLGIQFHFCMPTQLRWNSKRGKWIKPTLSCWMDAVPDGEYIVNITGHYIVVHNDLVFDNRFHLGKSVCVCPYLRRRVKAAWRIER